MDHRRLADALRDLQIGLSEAAKHHAKAAYSPRTGVLLALDHIDRFLRLVLPSANRVPLDELSTALAALDAGITEPLVEIQLERRRRGTTVSQTDVRALLAGAVTFLIDKQLPGTSLGLNPACHVVARAANRLGFRDSNGGLINKSSIKMMRNELLANRSSTGGRMTDEQLLRLAIKNRGRDRQLDYYHLCRLAQIKFATASRGTVVERVLRQFRMHTPTRRT